MTSQATHLANIYTYLAEALATTREQELPSWFSTPGRQWPFYTSVTELADQEVNPAYSLAKEAMVALPACSNNILWEQGVDLFFNYGERALWLNESYYVDGRFPGPTTFAVKALYTQAGLDVAGAELPDHASNELAFLAYLADNENSDQIQAHIWRAARQLFIKNHAGHWLMRVGHELSNCPHPVWVALGHVLKASLRPEVKPLRVANPELHLPFITNVEVCNLCGFCIGVCPTRALGIYEDERATSLWLKPSMCTRCSKCLSVCPQDALSFSDDNLDDGVVVLRESPRAICSSCGEPTVSETELAAVAAMLGQPEWLSFCLKCRAEKVVVG